jgi:hypothetical protein
VEFLGREPPGSMDCLILCSAEVLHRYPLPFLSRPSAKAEPTPALWAGAIFAASSASLEGALERSPLRISKLRHH